MMPGNSVSPLRSFAMRLSRTSFFTDRRGNASGDAARARRRSPSVLTVEIDGMPDSIPASGLSPLIKDRLPGGASRLAALLLPQILPVFSVVTPCHPGAALRNALLVQRRQAT